METKKDIVRLPDLKNYLINKVQKLFYANSFKLNKSECSFKKETETSIIEFHFEFHGYYPSHNEYSFYSYIILKELKDIIALYKKFNNDGSEIMWNVLIVEGEFIHELLEQERKFKKLYTNEVNSIDSIEISLNQTLKIIESEALPMIYPISTLTGFQKYFLIPQKIMSRINEGDFILSCLLASYLIDKQFYFEVVEFLLKELDKMKASGQNLESIYILIDKTNDFVKHKSNTPTK